MRPNPSWMISPLSSSCRAYAMCAHTLPLVPGQHPAAGGSLLDVECQKHLRSDRSDRSVEGDHGWTLAFPDQPIDGRAAGLLERLARHTVPEWCQLGVGFGPELGE